MTDDQRIKLELLREKLGNGLLQALRLTRDRLGGPRPDLIRVEEVIDALYAEFERRPG